MNPSSSDKSRGNDVSVLAEEADTSRSLAATLKMIAAKGYIDKDTKRKPTVVLSSQSKKAELESRSYTIEEKREEHRAYKKRNSQLKEVRETEDYKPEINLDYTDDSGRRLETPKEQFRYMCHKFHGKGPGKNKIDKRLRKLELESKMKQALSTDSTASSTAKMIEKQKELQTPFIVLSKGK